MQNQQRTQHVAVPLLMLCLHPGQHSSHPVRVHACLSACLPAIAGQLDCDEAVGGDACD